ncbi:hypothetical protein ALC53_01768 [Atta colombica]|uniref:DUF8207 domain-containing protein n=1 Tax=Atta colombica TaxID=520822 RepID=A0A151I668_9HYME|nr:hypothetical protein ALC53_01768 [Atta colombica]
MNRDSPPNHDPPGDSTEGNLNAATVYAVETLTTEVGNYGRQSLGNSSGVLPSGTNWDFGTPRSAFPIEVRLHPVPSTSSEPHSATSLPMELSSPSFMRSITFMLDTGAQPNGKMSSTELNERQQEKLGDKYFDVDSNDFVIVDGVKYKGTLDLYELIFKRIPDNTIYTENDKLAYISILLATNAQGAVIKRIIQ